MQQVVVAGCHSLTIVDGALHGDPLEASALEGIRWDWNATSHTAFPRDLRGKSYDNSGTGNQVNASVNPDWKPQQEEERASKSVGDSGGESFSSHPDGFDSRSTVDVGFDGMSVSVWRRHAFSSQLQRMSVVVQVSGIEGLTKESGVPEVCRSCHDIVDG